MDVSISQQYFSYLRTIDPNSRDHNVLRMAALCHFELLDIVNEQIELAGNKPDIQAQLAEALRISHGEGFTLTQHGIYRSITGRFKGDYLPVIVSLFCQFMNRLEHDLGISAFVTSGTLLGLVRDRAFIPHDDDFDLAYVSREHNLPNVVLERRDLFGYLRTLEGYTASECTGGHFHINFDGEGSKGFLFDLFTAWVDDQGRFNEYPLRPETLPASEILPLGRADFYGSQVPVPHNAEAFLELNYGPDWRVPDPFFRFPWGETEDYYSYLTGNKLGDEADHAPSAVQTFGYLPLLSTQRPLSVTLPDGDQALAEAIACARTLGEPRPNIVVIGDVPPALGAVLALDRDMFGQVWVITAQDQSPATHPGLAHILTVTPDTVADQLRASLTAHRIGMVIIGDGAETEISGTLNALVQHLAGTAALVFTRYVPDPAVPGNQNAVWWRFARTSGRICRFAGRTRGTQVVAKAVAKAT